MAVSADSLSPESDWKVSAVSRDRQSTVTSPPTTLNQLCLKGDVPSNLSWKPVRELSFIPIRTSSSAHWAECFPAKGEQVINRHPYKRYMILIEFHSMLAFLISNVLCCVCGLCVLCMLCCCVYYSIWLVVRWFSCLVGAATSGTQCRVSWHEGAAQSSPLVAPKRNQSPTPAESATVHHCWWNTAQSALKYSINLWLGLLALTVSCCHQ